MPWNHLAPLGATIPDYGEPLPDRRTREENARLAELVAERRRIKAIAGMVERVNGWERLDELVDAMLERR